MKGDERNAASGTGSLAQRIARIRDHLGPGARQVAEALLRNPEEVALSTAITVARRVKVSETTVVRLAVLLGFDGYPGLRRHLQEILRRTLNPMQRLDHHPPGHGREQPFAQSLRLDLENLAATRRELSPEGIKRAAALICAARRTFILGLRSSFGVAHSLHCLLDQTLGTATLLDPARGEMPDQLVGMGPRDVLVGISFPRYTRLTPETMALAARRQARVIAITDGLVSPLAAHADVVLVARCDGFAFANSHVTALALVNALGAEITARNRGRTLTALTRLERALRETNVALFDGSSPPPWPDARTKPSRRGEKRPRPRPTTSTVRPA